MISVLNTVIMECDEFQFTVIPIRYRVVCRGFESDGLQIVHVLKNNMREHQ